MEQYDPHPSRQPGRWSSGRLLSETARQKKRENDRRSKANARKRDREHTQDLEARCEELLTTSDEQRMQIEALHRRIDVLEGTNGRFRKELEQYAGASPSVTSHRSPIQSQDSVTYSNMLSNHHQNIPDWRNQVSSFADAQSITMTRGVLPPSTGSSQWSVNATQQHLVSPVYPMDVDQQTYVEHSSGAVPIPSQPHAHHTNMGVDLGNLSNTMDSYIHRIRELNIDEVSFDDDYNQDALIRIAVWNQPGNTVCPILDLIARAERTFARYVQIPLIEKLAIIRQVHRLMLYDVGKHEKEIHGLPDWYRPTKLQKHKKHTGLTDYMPWPDFRDRLILGLKSPRLDEKFWISFSLNFHIVSDIQDASTCFQATSDGRYVFTPTFENIIKDLHCWRVGADFFDEYPELFTDIFSDSSYRSHVPGRVVAPSNDQVTSAGAQNNTSIERATINNHWPS